jgi:hypothetical protein
MAERWAVATGVWSSTATWNGGTLPASGDDVYANGFTVTIDQTVTANSLRIIAGTTAVQGGAFTCSASVTITLNELSVGAFAGSGSAMLTLSAGATTLNVANPITGDSSSSGSEPVTLLLSGGTHTVNADVQGGSATSGSYAIRLDTATLTLNGDVTGAVASGLFISSTSSRAAVRGTLTVSGTVPAVTVFAGIMRYSGDAHFGSAGAAPFTGTVVLIAGEETNLYWPDDSDFPTSAAGTPTLVSTSTGGGGVDPKRFLNVGGVAVAIQ